MPKLSEIKDSNYLTKEDVGPGVLLTIKDCVQEEVGREREKLWCLGFLETEKRMVLKSTNAALIQGFLGGDHTDQWTGKKVVLYNDKTVAMGGKPVGGIRVRAPRTAQSTLPPAAPAALGLPAEEGPPVDDVPF
jgi:hypothetical protein